MLDVINAVVKKWVIADFYARKARRLPKEDDEEFASSTRTLELSDAPSEFSFKIAAMDNDIEAASILAASGALGKAELTSKIRQLTELEQLLRNVEISFAHTDLAKEERSILSIDSANLEERMIAGVGLVHALPATVRVALSVVSRELRQLRAKSAEFENSRGRPRNQAAHKVARAVADFYITNRALMPTYSEDTNGLHGEFTPLLKDIFIALGWPNIALRGPAEAAIASITPEDFERLKYPFKNHRYD